MLIKNKFTEKSYNTSLKAQNPEISHVIIKHDKDSSHCHALIEFDTIDGVTLYVKLFYSNWKELKGSVSSSITKQTKRYNDSVKVTPEEQISFIESIFRVKSHFDSNFNNLQAMLLSRGLANQLLIEHKNLNNVLKFIKSTNCALLYKDYALNNYTPRV